MKKKRVYSVVMILVLVFVTAACTPGSAVADESTAAEGTTAVAEESTTVEGTTAVENTEEAYDLDYLVLVNKDNKIPDDWDQKVHLSSATDANGEEVFVESETLKKFYELQSALAEQQVNILIDSGYRSVADEEEFIQQITDRYGEGFAQNFVAAPGYSEHQTGLAIDICIQKDDSIVDDKIEMLDMFDVFSPILAALPEYGFILRYNWDSSEAAGYPYMPWHIRYVGSPEVAKAIYESKSLEGYLGR